MAYKGKAQNGDKTQAAQKGKPKSAPKPTESVKVSGRAKGLGGKTAKVTSAAPKPSYAAKNTEAKKTSVGTKGAPVGAKKASSGAAPQKRGKG